MRPDMRQGPEIWIRGPVPVPEAASPPPPVPAPDGTRRFSWVGAHGGAGTTTLAEVYGGQDRGRRWPGPGELASVLLVARTHATGLAAAGRALEAMNSRNSMTAMNAMNAPRALVLVADAPGRLPRPLAQRVRLLEASVDVHRVPWVPAWRLGDLTGAPPRGTESLARLTGAGR
ncbi:DUF6668 family protein [Streptomyces ziwulingensis]|uniref:Uncharacterized protein n=1 Tax=Streptomyces ziwulingensis TaxID=1045501 RepID=A0ABP9ARM2_9ACTN